MTTLLIKNSYLHGHDFSWFINRENNISKVEKDFSFKFYLLIKISVCKSFSIPTRKTPGAATFLFAMFAMGSPRPASWFFTGPSLTAGFTTYPPSVPTSLLFFLHSYTAPSMISVLESENFPLGILSLFLILKESLNISKS